MGLVDVMQNQIRTSVDALKSTLVVSCQASAGDPLDDVDALRRVALAALAGGAGGLRLNSAECIAAVRPHTRVPIIGIKKVGVQGRVRITPDFASALELATAGADIIALDCTDRNWAVGEPWRSLVDRIHRELGLPVMADIATIDEALAASVAGADMIGTTLSGYTEDTRSIRTFNWELLASATQQSGCPVVAEGHITTPEHARRAIGIGAWCIVVGAAITQPGTITERFVHTIRSRLDGDPAVAIDIGATSIKAGLVKREGSIQSSLRVPTAKVDAEAIASSAASAIDGLLQQAQSEGIKVAGIGIASAGVIDADTGTVFAATENLPGWTGFNLREFAQKRFQLPTSVENDAHAAALAELVFGAGRYLQNFVCITLGTGVGGAVVIDRKLVRGQHGFAGAFGHSVIRWNGRPCNCGQRGCLESYVSAAALMHEYKHLVGRSDIQPSMSDVETVCEIGRLASQRDAAALEAYAVLAGYLAEGIANIFNLLDPQAVLISGGLVEGRPEFLAAAEKRVIEILHFGSKRKPCIRAASGGDQSGVLGAAASVFSSERKR